VNWHGELLESAECLCHDPEEMGHATTHCRLSQFQPQKKAGEPEIGASRVLVMDLPRLS